MLKHKSFSSFALIALLSGCANLPSIDESEIAPEKNYSNMYLRGIFNWWEVRENFKLRPTKEDEYSVTIELIADGQPYDFKVADDSWSMPLNCGNGYGAAPIELNKKRELVCANDSLNLQFTPSATGAYTFTLNVSDNLRPYLVVTQ